MKVKVLGAEFYKDEAEWVGVVMMSKKGRQFF